MKANRDGFLGLSNGGAVRLKEIPFLAFGDFSRRVVQATAAGERISALFGAAGRKAGATELYAVLADDENNLLSVGRTEVEGAEFPSLTPECPQAHLFEREIAEQFGLKPVGHPWLKPVRYLRSLTGRDAWGRDPAAPILPGVGDFYRVEGEQVHEVAVGPVHAGVIEPGHFRFQCHGEKVFHLEIALGYQHRGAEEAMAGGPSPLSLHLAETAAGDTSIGHATSYCQNLEALARCPENARALGLRGVALELERLANHVGDLGALSGDVGYLPTASFCGRIRGDFLNLTAFLCGNRFGRGMIVPGGVGFDLSAAGAAELKRRLETLKRESAQAIELLWSEQTVMARFEDTGPLSRAQALELGIVGPPARAAGLMRDARYGQPSGIYRFSQVAVSTYDSGDVFGRAYLRWMEIQRSLEFIMEQLEGLAPAAPAAPPGKLAPESLAVSINEGWRGEICHVALTDARGSFARYKIVDPSFHNWMGLALAMRDQEISDFPLCNKSFNLSYCGHDL